MKTKMKLMLLVVAMAVIVGASMNPVSAATLTLDETVLVSFHKSEFNISVYPGKASYSGTNMAGDAVTGVFGDGTVLGYRFFNSDGLVLSSYADDGTGIVAPVVPGPDANDLDGTESWANVWTTTDPGVDFAIAADYTADTLARGRNITGTIDISDLSSGTAYVICGGIKETVTLTMTMSGAGQTDIQAEYSIDLPTDIILGKNYFWVAPFDFSDAVGYETITYHYTISDLARRGRFVGVIIDNVVSDATVEIHTPAMMTWSNNPVGLDATITDSGLSPLTYGWTAVPDGIGDPNIIVDFDSGAEDPVVTVTNLTEGKVTVVMTLTAFDDANPDEIAEASVEIDVYPNACEMAIIGLGTPVAATDLNRDCITNLLDFAEMASAWLDDYAATEAVDR